MYIFLASITSSQCISSALALGSRPGCYRVRARGLTDAIAPDLPQLVEHTHRPAHSHQVAHAEIELRAIIVVTLRV